MMDRFDFSYGVSNDFRATVQGEFAFKRIVRELARRLDEDKDIHPRLRQPQVFAHHRARLGKLIERLS